MLLVSVVIGIVGRALPETNVLVMAMPARVLVGVGSELFPPQTWRMSSAWEAGAAFKAEQLAAMAAAAGWGGGPGGMAPLLRGLDGAYELSGPESKA